MSEFQQGLRPELFDKGMIKERVKAMIMGESNAAALANEIATELAAEMGISMPGSAGQDTAGARRHSNRRHGRRWAICRYDRAGSAAGTTFAAGFTTTAGGGASWDDCCRHGAIVRPVRHGGQECGHPVGAAFYAAAQTGLAPQLIDLFVTLVTPGVKAAIDTQGTQTTPNDTGGNTVYIPTG